MSDSENQVPVGLNPSFPRFKGRSTVDQRTGLVRPLGNVSQNPSLPIQTRKRNHKPEFLIFVDAAASNETPKRAKTGKNGLRTPLSVRSDSANSTPSPSPRLPTTPFPASVFDPLWFNRENYDPSPPSPPSTPTGPALGPTPIVGPLPPPSPRARISRVHRVVGPSILPTPRNTILYDLLEIQDRNARSLQITAAYRKVAMRDHPDKVPEAQREAATEKMQLVNLAKEVLLDPFRRRQYHVSVAADEGEGEDEDDWWTGKYRVVQQRTATTGVDYLTEGVYHGGSGA